jgi:uncharacterized protein YgiM (DUF1202 family)
MVTATIAQLSAGDTVRLTGYRSADGGWVQVKLAGVDGGWVPAEAIKARVPTSDLAVIESGARNIAGVAVVTADLAPVLESAGPAEHVVTQLAQGEPVELSGYRTAEGDWVQVVLPDNRSGWVDVRAIASDFPLFALSVMDAPAID